MYNWQLPDWPNFTYDRPTVQQWLRDYEEKMSAYLAAFSDLPELDQHAIYIANLVEDGVQSSSIEGEDISRADVQSSLVDRLRFGPGPKPVADLRARGVANLMQEVTQNAEAPITDAMVRYWHELLFQGQNYPGVTGTYRSGLQPMRIVSGTEYNQTVHFEAPPADRVTKMMEVFYDAMSMKLPAVLMAGIGHVHFESIHPFSDGNGRIGRAIMERLILRPIGGRPLLSISHPISLARSDYYAALQEAQRGLDLTNWLEFFFQMLNESIILAQDLTRFTLAKVKYFDRFSSKVNVAQEKALRKMWEAGPSGFQGGMTAKKFGRINRVSSATATRDLAKLTQLGALERRGGGRSTHYVLPENEKSG